MKIVEVWAKGYADHTGLSRLNIEDDADPAVASPKRIRVVRQGSRGAACYSADRAACERRLRSHDEPTRQLLTPSIWRL